MRLPIRTTAALAAIFTLAILTTGCDRRTPEERLKTAFEFQQQGDQLSAEMEAIKVIEKAPEDPASVQANLLLAQIYAGQNRFDEAEMQMQSALKNVSQLEPMGKEVLRMYLALLNTQKKYDEALKTIDKYKEEYAEDPGTSISLVMAGVEIRTMAGQTTAARETLSDIIAQTTAPEEMSLYRQLYVSTFLRDENTSAAIAYLEIGLPAMEKPEDKHGTMAALASLYARLENYEKSRFYLEGLTGVTMDAIKQAPDARNRIGLVMQLGQTYLGLGNLPGGKRVFETLYQTNLSEPEAVVAAVNGLTESLLRLGETSATEALLMDVARKYPDAPFADQLKRMEGLIAKGELQQLEPMDTTTLALKYKADANVLWPETLPEALGVSTSGTVTASDASGTTDTQPVLENVDVTTPALSLAPETGAVSPDTTPTATVVSGGSDPLTTTSGDSSLPPLDETLTTSAAVTQQ